MPAHSLELLLDEPTDALIQAQWQALIDAGLPSAGQHRSSSNRPHVTLLACSQMPSAVVEITTALFASRVPLTVRWGGLVLFGKRKHVLARLVEVSPELAELVATLQRAAGDVVIDPQRAWIPHVTLCRGLRPEDVSAALAAVSEAHDDEPFELTELRWWNPEERTITPLL